MDRLTEMEVFVSVVEAGGFTDAGRRLGISKSAVSKHVAALEARLGARLLHRTTRTVNPTDIGIAYLDKARQALAAARDADQLATSMQGTPVGELKITAPISFGLRYVAPALASFLDRHEKVTAQLEFDDTVVDIMAGGYDLAIRIGHLPDSSLIARKLALTEMNICAAPGYLERTGTPENVSDLGQHELLHYSLMATGSTWKLGTAAAGETGGASGDASGSATGQEQALKANGRLTVNNGDALAQAARDGLGIALLPNFICAADLSTGRLVEIMPAHRPPPLGIFALYPSSRYLQPKLRVFIDHLADSLRDKGPQW